MAQIDRNKLGPVHSATYSDSERKGRAETAEARLAKVVEALERWITARLVVLTLTDQLSSDAFKLAWKQLGDAEWELVALAKTKDQGSAGSDIAARGTSASRSVAHNHSDEGNS